LRKGCCLGAAGDRYLSSSLQGIRWPFFRELGCRAPDPTKLNQRSPFPADSLWFPARNGNHYRSCLGALYHINDFSFRPRPLVHERRNLTQWSSRTQNGIQQKSFQYILINVLDWARATLRFLNVLFQNPFWVRNSFCFRIADTWPAVESDDWKPAWWRRANVMFNWSTINNPHRKSVAVINLRMWPSVQPISINEFWESDITTLLLTKIQSWWNEEFRVSISPLWPFEMIFCVATNKHMHNFHGTICPTQCHRVSEKILALPDKIELR
jgi:hypothetical protein